MGIVYNIIFFLAYMCFQICTSLQIARFIFWLLNKPFLDESAKSTIVNFMIISYIVKIIFEEFLGF